MMGYDPGEGFGAVNIRKGFRCFGAKIKKGRVNIAYLGSSNTAARNGWRGGVQAWFNEKFPGQDGNHTEIDLSLGGVGSITGVFIAKEWLKDKKPDMVFIEFLPSDFRGPANKNVDMVSHSAEALVRIAKSANPDCDICFLYFFHGHSDEHMRGEPDRVQKIYENIADHYGIPSIDVARFVFNLSNSSEMNLTGEGGKPAIYRQDMAHPTAEGNKKILEFIKKSLLSMIEKSGDVSIDTQLPQPVNNDNLEEWKICYVKKEMLAGRYTKVEKTFGNIGKPLECFSLLPGARLSFRVKGHLLGLYVVIGPNSGIIRCDMGGEPILKKLFDSHCHFTRIWAWIMSQRLDNMKYLNGANITIELLDHIPEDGKYSNPAPAKKPSEWTLDIIGMFVIGDVV